MRNMWMRAKNLLREWNQILWYEYGMELYQQQPEPIFDENYNVTGYTYPFLPKLRHWKRTHALLWTMCCGLPSIAKAELAAWTCKRKGHDWRDESYAGPDSGCVSLTCERCGTHHHSWLY